MAKINADSYILVVGCGAIPVTPIILSDKTKIKIIAIDNDPKAVVLASRFVEKHHLQEKIEIACFDGVKYQAEDFDVIFVSYGVERKEELMKYLSENISNNSKIVCRVSRDFDNKKQNFYYLSNFFKIEDIIRTYSFGPMDSYLLTKKKIDD
ncbi:MAG: methyltransferase domain-containing protein [Thermoplasmatales archaeon]|nr:methyltransferase domain-containing protein [Thermoplasmatales archaeon]